ncbi:MAG: hypothetical protein AAGA59_01175 [Actinomycetota bacterium]
MSDKTLGNARGLNSIADPKQFKGSAGRAKLARRRDEPESPPPPPSAEAAPTAPPASAPGEAASPVARRAPAAEPPANPADAPEDAAPARTRAGRKASPRAKAKVATAPSSAALPDPAPAAAVAAPTDSAPRSAPHRAVQPGVQRKRRELSIPHPVAEALEATGINPADVVMAGYRNHGDAIYAGAGGRMAARGRTRLRLSISDTEFEQITRLGLARGWNRSETVSVILALELESRAAAN